MLHFKVIKSEAGDSHRFLSLGILIEKSRRSRSLQRFLLKMKLDIIIKFGFHALLAGPGTALGLVRATGICRSFIICCIFGGLICTIYVRFLHGADD